MSDSFLEKNNNLKKSIRGWIRPTSLCLPHLFLLLAFLMLQLFDPVCKPGDPRLLEHQALGEVLGQCIVDGVLDLVKLQLDNHIKFVQLLLLLKL
jgi:hypothetical protein